MLALDSRGLLGCGNSETSHPYRRSNSLGTFEWGSINAEEGTAEEDEKIIIRLEQLAPPSDEPRSKTPQYTNTGTRYTIVLDLAQVPGSTGKDQYQ